MKYTFLLLVTVLPFFAGAQTISTIAGNGTPSYGGDGGSATGAELSRPIGVTMDAECNLYISDYNNARIRKVTVSGIISTVAGTGSAGFSGDGGMATAAQIGHTEKITVDAAGNIYFADFTNHRVRKITTAGIITTIAGNGTPGYSGDGGPATAAELWYPSGIAVDATGNVYISDEWNNRIRKVNTAGVISTIAGNGPTGYLLGGFGGDGGPATSAAINFPVGITTTPSGSIVFSDCGNNRLRQISTTGIITTIAGTGTAASGGDGGPATAAQLNGPEGVIADATGNVYVCEITGNRVRNIDASGNIHTFAGNGTPGFTGDSGPATAAEVHSPEGVFVDLSTSCVYVADAGNNRIRRIGSCAGPVCAAVVVACDSITMPDSLHLCTGDTVTIPAVLIGADSVYSARWQPGTGLSDTTITEPVLTATTPGWYTLTLSAILPENLVTNGDFSGGSLGFSTTYTPEGTGSTSTPGDYAVATDPNLYDGSWPAMGDHTTGSGNMLIIDGSYTSGASFWCETMTVTPGTNYIFTVWTALLHNPLPSIQLSINSINVGTITPPSIAGIWQQYQVLWNSGTATSANICMSDLMAAGFGNDFAIDDISLQPLCVAKDSVYVAINISDSSNTATNVNACALSLPVTLSAPSSYSSPNWSTGASTSNITVPGAGTYWVRSAGSCFLFTDTFNVSLHAVSSDTTTSDTTLCPGPVTLNAPLWFTSYTWNTGSTTASIIVNSNGNYSVVNADTAACARHVAEFAVNYRAIPQVQLGNDTTLCQGSTLLLSPQTNVTGSYLWNTGSTNSSITITTAGTYIVTITDSCSASDTIQIAELPLPVINLGPDTAICDGNELLLSTGNTATSWNTGAWGSSILVEHGGTYVATEVNNCGIARDTIVVEVDPCNIGVPSAFSPNGDMSNDVLYVRGEGAAALTFRIYDRWGEMVFETNDAKIGWDGSFKGQPQPVGVYGYVVSATMKDGTSRMIKGNVTLLR